MYCELKAIQLHSTGRFNCESGVALPYKIELTYPKKRSHVINNSKKPEAGSKSQRWKPKPSSEKIEAELLFWIFLGGIPLLKWKADQFWDLEPESSQKYGAGAGLKSQHWESEEPSFGSQP